MRYHVVIEEFDQIPQSDAAWQRAEEYHDDSPEYAAESAIMDHDGANHETGDYHVLVRNETGHIYRHKVTVSLVYDYSVVDA